VVQRYVFPESIESCIEALERSSGTARIIAGGTDLVLAIERGERDPATLLDITRISELEGITEEGHHVRLGARVTHAACVSSPLIQRAAACLAEACATVGSPQIQHIGTVAGNVVNAQPAADGAIALVALGATARIISTRGEREESVENLYLGVGRSRVDSSTELLTHLFFSKAKAGEGSAFLRVAPRNAMGLPVLNGAIWVLLKEERISDIRIALGPVSDRPFRPEKTETILKESRWDDTGLSEEAAGLAAEEATPRDSLLRGSAAYRRELIRMVMKRLLKAAIGRARNESVPLAGTLSL
jgi:carbon-monoxide dehydrogenase medium subunit